MSSFDDSDEDAKYALRRSPERTYITGRFKNEPSKRFAIRVWDANDAPRFAWADKTREFDVDTDPETVAIRHEEYLSARSGSDARYQIKVAFIETSREIQEIVLQKFTVRTGKPHKDTHISLSPEQSQQLIRMLMAISRIKLEDGKRERIDDQVLEALRNDNDRKEIFSAYPELADAVNADILSYADPEQLRSIIDSRGISKQVISKLLESDVNAADIAITAQRKIALSEFENLLNDPDYFERRRNEWNCVRIEDVWQKFFEKNTWILGYGLQYQFGDTIAAGTLQQTVKGHSFIGGGKRIDALLKTLGAINTLCFVEIKTHATQLMGKNEVGGRSEIFAPSKALVEAVAQVQITVQRSLSVIEEQVRPPDENGYQGGEILHTVSPRSLVICGDLHEFMDVNGSIHLARFRAFELYRRALRHPEVITFDELYERARHIVGGNYPA